jgi:hypothetical protein
MSFSRCRVIAGIDPEHVSSSDDPDPDPDHLEEGTDNAVESAEEVTIYASRFHHYVPAIFIIMGILSGMQMIVEFFCGHFSLIFSIFCIPVGLGLKNFQYSSYRWARFWAIVSVIGCLVILLVGIAGYGHWTYRHKPWFPPVWVKASAAIFFGLGALLMYTVDQSLRNHKMLYRPIRSFRVRHPPSIPKVVFGKRPPGR